MGSVSCVFLLMARPSKTRRVGQRTASRRRDGAIRKSIGVDVSPEAPSPRELSPKVTEGVLSAGRPTSGLPAAGRCPAPNCFARRMTETGPVDHGAGFLRLSSDGASIENPPGRPTSGLPAAFSIMLYKTDVRSRGFGRDKGVRGQRETFPKVALCPCRQRETAYIAEHPILQICSRPRVCAR